MWTQPLSPTTHPAQVDPAPTIMSSPTEVDPALTIMSSPTEYLRRPMAPAVGTLAGSQARLMAPVLGAYPAPPAYSYMAAQPIMPAYTAPATAVYPAPSMPAFRAA